MRGFLAVFKRELRGYFDSPIAYIFMVVFLLVNCGLYMSSFFLIGRLEIRSMFSLLPFVLIVFIPAITMRLWAEEKKQGTYELILTLPVRTSTIVLAKFFSSLFFFTLSLAGTLVIPLMLFLLGTPDLGPIIGGYFGSIALGAFFISIGIFISGFSKDQIVAFILAMITCFFFYMAGTSYIAVQLDGWTGPLALGTFLQNYIGITNHFAGIEKGVIDLRDLFFFLSMTALFLILNTVYLAGRAQRGEKLKFTVWSLAVCAVVIFSNVVVSGTGRVRYDLTEDKIYTVSPGSKQILSKLTVPVTVNLYITSKEKMPSVMKNLEQDIIDKLEEFKISSDGKLTYNIYDPASDPALAEKLEKKGISPFQVQSVEADEIGVKLIYSAITISYLDKKEEILPAVHIQNFFNLEYDLISGIYKMVSEKKPKVAVFSSEEHIDPALAELYMKMGREIPQSEEKYMKLAALLQEEDYDVVNIELTEDSLIPNDIDLLIVVSPKNLNERQRYEIARQITKGTKVIFAVQNYLFNYSALSQRGIDVSAINQSPAINDLLKNYGVEIDENILMDNNNEVLSIPSRRNVLGMFTAMVNTPVKLPVQIKLISENMNQDLSMTNKLAVLLYLWGSSLKIDDKKVDGLGVKSQILMTSSEQSWTIPFKPTPLLDEDIQPPAKFDGRKPLGVMLSGTFPDPYKDKPAPSWDDHIEDQQADLLAQTNRVPENIKQAPGKIIVIGAGEMFNDAFIEAGNNALFMLNAVDSLALGEELINIRGKQQQIEMLPQLSPAAKLWFRFFTVFLPPIIIITIGLIKYFLRRRSKEKYLTDLTQNA